MTSDNHSKSHRYDLFADQYARFGFTDTYYLGFRDLPKLLKESGTIGGDALDHGCGSGKSTRFLKELGFRTVGVDQSLTMLTLARESDPSGDYRHVLSANLGSIDSQSIDLIFQSSVLEEYASTDLMHATLKEFQRVLRPNGKVMILTASEAIATGDWASFSYPDRGYVPKSGEQVRCLIRNSDIEFSDYYWTDKDLRNVFTDSGFKVLMSHSPLAYGDEPYQWIDETKRSPWSVYVLQNR